MRTVVRGRKEPRKRRRKGKGRLEEKLWRCPLGVVLRQRLTSRHNNRNDIVDAKFRQFTQFIVSLEQLIRAGNYFTLF